MSLSKIKRGAECFHIHFGIVVVILIIGTVKIFYSTYYLYDSCSRKFTYKNMFLFNIVFFSIHKEIEIPAIKRVISILSHKEYFFVYLLKRNHLKRIIKIQYLNYFEKIDTIS